jgi:hypothetical protein
MSDNDLNVLEREVEAARGRVSSDLARIKSPAALAAFKDELWREARGTKNELLGRAKDSATGTAQNLLGDIRRRAAANPAAVLAIGAGLLWHLVKHPPVTTLLVGVGVVSLLKTTPSASGDFAEGLSAQANAVATAVRDKAHDWSASATEAAKDIASQTVSAVSDQAEALADKASDLMGNSRRLGSDLVASAPSMEDMVPGREARDQLLLGAAALAVATAVGLSIQKRTAT